MGSLQLELPQGRERERGSSEREKEREGGRERGKEREKEVTWLKI